MGNRKAEQEQDGQFGHGIGKGKETLTHTLGTALLPVLCRWNDPGVVRRYAFDTHWGFLYFLAGKAFSLFAFRLQKPCQTMSMPAVTAMSDGLGRKGTRRMKEANPQCAGMVHMGPRKQGYWYFPMALAKHGKTLPVIAGNLQETVQVIVRKSR
jgi:hypothetical protein